MTDYPDFRSRAFLLDHVDKTMGFFYPAGFDPAGGFFNELDNVGAVADPRPRSLVHTCRSLFIHANAYRLFGRAENLAAAGHALDFLTNAHRVALTRGYLFELDFAGGKVTPTETANIQLPAARLCDGAATGPARCPPLARRDVRDHGGAAL